MALMGIYDVIISTRMAVNVSAILDFTKDLIEKL